MTASLPRLVAMSLHRGATWNAFLRAVAEVDELLRARSTAAATPRARCSACCAAAGIGRDELRDQVVTVLAAGHETTAGSLAWALERLAHHPAVAGAGPRRRRGLPRRRRQGGAARAARALDRRPPRRGAVRRRRPRAAARRARRAVHLPRPPPARGLAGRRRAFRPERFLERTPAPGTYLPFGGGVRRCAGAAFARSRCVRCCGRCSRASRSRRWATGAGRAHAPRLGDAAPVARRDRLDRTATTIRSRVALLPPQPPDRQLPDLQPGAAGRAAREGAAEPAAHAPASGSTAKRAGGASGRRSGVVTRRVARAADDGYRNPLAPGLRATADAERLAGALAAAAERLEPPGPYPEIAEAADAEQATLARVPARARRPRGARAAAGAARRPPGVGGRRAGGPARGAPPHRGGLPRLGRPRRHAGGRLLRRRGLDARAPLRPRVRAARAARLRPRAPVRPADRARRRRPLRAQRERAVPGPRGRPGDARRQARCWSPATGCCSTAARGSWPRRAGCRSPRSTAASRSGARRARRSTSPVSRPPRSARRWRCGERRGRRARPRRRPHARAARGAAAGELRGRGAADRRRRAAADARAAGAAARLPARRSWARAATAGCVGAVSFKRAGGTVDIHRLVVDPAPSAAASRPRCSTRWRRARPARRTGRSAPAPANAPARALYERRGFEVTEERDRAGRHPLGAHGPGGRELPSR